MGGAGCGVGDVREVISMAQLNVMYTFEQRESFAQMRKAKYQCSQRACSVEWWHDRYPVISCTLCVFSSLVCV